MRHSTLTVVAALIWALCVPTVARAQAIPPESADVNADGIVNMADVAIVQANLGRRCGQATFDARADVNRDCVVNVSDVAFVSRNLGATFPPTIDAIVSPAANAAGWHRTDVTVHFLCTRVAACPETIVVTDEGAGQIIERRVTNPGGSATAHVMLDIDKTPPLLMQTSPPSEASVFTQNVRVAGVAAELSGVNSFGCNGEPGRVFGTSVDCDVTLTPGGNTILLFLSDVADNSATSMLALHYQRAPVVTFLTPENLSYLNISPTTVTGTVDDPTATVIVNTIEAAVVNGHFSAAIPLGEGPNIVTATATTPEGATGTTSLQVTLDTTPPRVTVTSPPEQFVTTEPAISVAGNVNDIVVGTVNAEQAQVTVNGVSAAVANRTFLAESVPLELGTNVLRVLARDRVGNAATSELTVIRQHAAGARINVIAGNNQTGVIGTPVPAPLVVALTAGSGQPAEGVPVIFKVTQNDGLVAVDGPPAPTVVATTDAQGMARVHWTLGMRAGAGGNTVEAYAVGYGGAAIFAATGTLGPAGNIVIDTGNDQIGAIAQPLPKPLIAVVVDAGHNRLGGVPVTFTVREGGGSVGGESSYTVHTDPDGRAAAILTLGQQEGNANNLVQATFPGNEGFPAVFTASGRAPGDPARTTIAGVVLDNSNVPIPGVTVRAVLKDQLRVSPLSVQTVPAVQTDDQGQFLLLQAPVGLVEVFVDGSTADRPGVYPTLAYDFVTVAGQDNHVGLPIYLLPLNGENQLCVSSTTGGGTLTIPEAPGFSLTFGPGQVTFPGGSKAGCVSVTVVNREKVPMVPGFGQQPRFIVTIQPAGAVFNPPAAITLPNVDALPPRAVTEMYSFDHDISSFVAIGTGVVSDDGRVIRSSPGVGVLKAGWHCGGDPQARGAAATCGPCKLCTDGITCVIDPVLADQSCDSSPARGCYTCRDGDCRRPNCGASTNSEFFRFDLGPISGGLGEMQTRINDGLRRWARGRPFGVSVAFSALNGGRTRSYDCCPDCREPQPSPLGWTKDQYDFAATVSASGSIDYCANDRCLVRFVVPFLDIRLSAGITSAPNLTVQVVGGGSGGGSVIHECPSDVCGFVTGNITLSASLNAGAAATATAEDFAPDSPGCPPEIAPANAIDIPACWTGLAGIAVSAFTSLTSNRLASVDGVLRFPLPGSTCLTSRAQCTVTGADVAVRAGWEFRGEVFGVQLSYGNETLIELFHGFTGSCAEQ